MTEVHVRREKGKYISPPSGLEEGDAKDAWVKMSDDKNDHFNSNITNNSTLNKIQDVFSKNCVLYFPPNRFEEPAWLNEQNLNAKAQYMDLKHLEGYANRKVINYSPLHDNQNWLFEVVYDRAAFEIHTSNLDLPIENSNATIPLPVFSGYSGKATSTYETALHIVRSVTATPQARFGIGRRHNRVVSIESESRQLVPNIFQLSSGETALLNLFLSILRDFDLTGSPFNNSVDICGIAVVDEMDLHLHAIHQHEMLPALTKMFPKVQFVVTTHSPLFVLGMSKVFGEDGFAVYRMPEGQQISPEEFSEFGDAYLAFKDTVKYSKDMRTAVEQAQKPIVFVEGATDEDYIKRAAVLLGKEAVLERIEVKNGGGEGKLKNIWNKTGPLPDAMSQKVLLLFDCDTGRESANNGNLYQRSIPLKDDNPVNKGIENLFDRDTLNKAIAANPSVIDIDGERTKKVRGIIETVPETWTVNTDEKANLCVWLCENGTAEDFRHFSVVFELLEELLG